MSEQFDAYHEWLGIAPKDQPPNHYRLLAVDLFEEKPSTIEHAADQRMAHLRTFQTGKHSALSQKLLNEVAAARICLLNAKKKAAYDARLREQLHTEADDSSGTLDSDLMKTLEQAESRKGIGTATADSKRPPKRAILVGLVAAIAVVVLAAIAWLAWPGQKPPLAVAPAPQAIEQPAAPRSEPPAAPMVKKIERVAVSAQPPAPPEPKKETPKPVQTPPASPPAAPAAPAGAKPTAQPTPSPLTSPPAKPAESPPPTPTAKPASTQAQAAPQPESAPTPAAGAVSPQAQTTPQPESPPRSTPARRRLPVPEGPALEKAQKAAEDLFKPEIAKAKAPADKAALARRLLSQAVDQPAPADKYVLMRMAEDLAASARQAETALEVVDQMAEAFEVAPFARKAQILSAWAKDARTADARKWIIEQILSVGEASIDAGNLEVAQELGRLATGKAMGLREVAPKMKVFRQRFTEAGKDAEQLKEAREALAKDPKDAKANLVVGQYLCFTKCDWEKGLPRLALGNDETLKALANQELESANIENDAKVILADGWWEIASTRSRRQSSTIKTHAAQWYNRAAGTIPPGLVKNKVEQRLREAAKLRSQFGLPLPAVAPFDEKQAKQHQQRWAEYVGMPMETINSIGMKLVLIPPGEFEMGSTAEEIAAETQRGTRNNEWEGYGGMLPREAPRHRVKMTRPFYLGMYPVTQDEYEKVVGVNPSAFTEKQIDPSYFKPPLWEAEIKSRPGDRKTVAGRDTRRHPVDTVSWDEAIEFCRKLSEMPGERAAGRVYRLPTEAEWEYACRAGTTTRWYSGDDDSLLEQCAWFRRNSGGMTHPVGQKRPNAWGLGDLHGNVWQWCQDWLNYDYYKQSPPSDPPGPSTGTVRVLRGGRWGSSPSLCRATLRDGFRPTFRTHSGGFRVVAGR